MPVTFSGVFIVNIENILNFFLVFHPSILFGVVGFKICLVDSSRHVMS